MIDALVREVREHGRRDEESIARAVNETVAAALREVERRRRDAEGGP